MTEQERRRKAAALRPNAGQEIRPGDELAHVNRVVHRTGEKVSHGVMGVRFAAPLPAEAKGPIRARETRRKKGVENA